MAYKIFTRGNYFYIIDTSTGRERDGLAKHVWVTRAGTASDNFRFYGVNDWANKTFLNITDILDEKGDAYTLENFIEFYESSTGENANSYVKISTNDTGFDAWGRPKVVLDNSILHGMFSFNVPESVWYERINDVIQATITNSTSVNGALNLQAGATLNDKTNLRTFRHPRYEPNRGIMFSTSAIIENPTALMNRRFGTATDESGVFFSLESGTLYGVVRTTKDTITSEDKVALDTTGIDLSKGNIFDIQYQWRGVGNYKFFINLKQVGVFDYLGTLTDLSMYNPSNPIFFEAENLGDNDIMKVGCVDISTEGGQADGKQYGSISIDNLSGSVAVVGYNTPVLVVKSKVTVASLINTRDVLALLASAYTDAKAIFRIWVTRDETAITLNDQSYSDFGDGHLEYVVYDTPDVTTPMTFDTTKAQLIFGCRVGVDSTYESSALFEQRTSVYQSPGDIFVFTMHKENAGACNVGVTYEFAEEI